MSQDLSIPGASIAVMAISGGIALLFPIILFMVLRKKRGLRAMPLFAGALVFVLFGLFLKSILAGILMSSAPIRGFLYSNALLFSLYGGLMAGIFEETGRLCAFSFMLGRRYNSLGGALSYGIGHGGVEALLFTVTAMASNIVYSVLYNTSGLDGLTAFAPGAAGTLGDSVGLLATTPALHFLTGGLERVIAICFHLAAPVLVWMAASGRGPWGLYFLSILLHTAVNIPAGFYAFAEINGRSTNIWAVEGITAVIVLAACVAAYMIYDKCSQTYTSLLGYNPMDFGI